MSLLSKLFGEENPENEGFRKVYETSFTQGHRIAHQGLGAIVSIIYNVDAEFFLNPEETIAYMVGEVKNRKVSVPVFREAEEEFKGLLGQADTQRIFAYSVCADGTEILTGNLGTEALNALCGGITLRVPEEILVDGKLLRNVRQRNVDSVLGSHKRYVEDLEIVGDPKLAERLAEAYTQLNNYPRGR
jgi:hypothetical protein